MAGILVHIEVEDGTPSAHALAVLGEGRRIASSLGAALHAVVVTTPGQADGERWATELGRGGADRVVVATVSRTEPALWATLGPALVRVCELVRPSLALLAASSTGRDIAPRLAAAQGGAFVAEPTLETGPRGEIILARPVYGGDLWRRTGLDDLDVLAVVTLESRRPPAQGHRRAELLTLAVEAPADPRIELVDAIAADDDAGALQSARIVVGVGGGVSAAAMPLVERLADALGAELGGTRAACARGRVSLAREIGVGVRRITPDLYVVCGASGSVAHLGAVSPDADIVAIDVDPEAPIFRAARWGLIGPIEQLVPGLLTALGAS